MTNDMQTNQTTHQAIPFGAKLVAARESLGLSRKEAGARLRLSEKVILMIEDNKFPADLPITFIRGYIRTYGNLLQIPESDIQQALEPIQPKVETGALPPINKTSVPLTSSHYYMQGLTSIIVFTLMALVAAWWYSHPSSSSLNESLSTPAESSLNSNHMKPEGTPTTVFSPVATNPTASSTQQNANLVKQSSVIATAPTSSGNNSQPVMNNINSSTLAPATPTSASAPTNSTAPTKPVIQHRDSDENAGSDDDDGPAADEMDDQ